VLYDYDYAGGLPVARSEIACLELLEHALDQGLRIGVHYCSLENKHTGQIYQQNTRGAAPPLFHFSERDYFLKSAKVFGQDVPKALAALQRTGYDGYRQVPGHEYLEFHVDKIPELAGLLSEVGISYNVREARDDGAYFRELRLDLTYPDAFDPATDI
jgi:hypothetical protein